MTPKSGYMYFCLFFFLSQVRHSTARIEWCKTMKHFDSFERFVFFLLSKRQEVQIERANMNMQLFMCVRVCLYTQV